LSQKLSIVFSKHALEMMELRNLNEEWVRQTLESPETEEIDMKDVSLKIAFRRITEFDNRWLRVVYRRDSQSMKVITVFFDRGMEKRK
jgi:hypothetical protein